MRRMKPDDRCAAILEAALAVAVREGYAGVSLAKVAEGAGVSAPLVLYHFADMDNLRRRLMVYAVQQECLPLIAQGMAVGDPMVRLASSELRERAVLWLSGRD